MPTDGKPLRGLIQDHVCAGVLLTKRDTFLDRGQFQQLMYLTLVDFAGSDKGGGATAGKSMAMPPPAVLKPTPLWTGKQVLTAILEHITHGRAPMTVAHGTKVPANYWGGDTSGEGQRRQGASQLAAVRRSRQEPLWQIRSLVHCVPSSTVESSPEISSPRSPVYSPRICSGTA